jgi:acyl-CoA thioesterase-2
MSLSDLLTLKPLGDDRFEGQSPDDGWKRIFGGLVVSQSLMAAYATVEGRLCHSLHSYFLRAGDPGRAVDYAVERTRDGASFCTRRVVASQDARVIFTLMASFQTPETGLEHQYDMPAEPPPEQLTDEMQRWLALGDDLPAGARAMASRPQRVEMRWAGAPAFETPQGGVTHKALWMRAIAPLPVGDIPMHQAALAYGSDMTFLSTALGVHGLGFWSPDMQSASLDHAVWLHRPTDFNAWHLYTQESASTSGGRGLVQGRMFRRDGTLVASMAQEGLMRVRGPGAGGTA